MLMPDIWKVADDWLQYNINHCLAPGGNLYEVLFRIHGPKEGNFPAAIKKVEVRRFGYLVLDY